MPAAPNLSAPGIARRIQRVKATGSFLTHLPCSRVVNVSFDRLDASLSRSEDRAMRGRPRPPSEQILP